MVPILISFQTYNYGAELTVWIHYSQTRLSTPCPFCGSDRHHRTVVSFANKPSERTHRISPVWGCLIWYSHHQNIHLCEFGSRCMTRVDVDAILRSLVGSFVRIIGTRH